jgi:hypothetical protein
MDKVFQTVRIVQYTDVLFTTFSSLYINGWIDKWMDRQNLTIVPWDSVHAPNTNRHIPMVQLWEKADKICYSTSIKEQI